MRPWSTRALALAVVLALAAGALAGCGHAAGAGPGRGEEVLERGGELAAADAVRATVTVTPASVTVWGLSEVPDGSRMQMAFAGVDAITRAALLKSVEVRISDLVASTESTDEARRTVVIQTVETVDGVLPRATKLPHGWARVRRNGEVVLRVWARFEVPRAELEGAVRSVLGRRGAGGDPVSFVDGLAIAPPGAPAP
jgi:hypothetical protein